MKKFKNEREAMRFLVKWHKDNPGKVMSIAVDEKAGRREKNFAEVAEMAGEMTGRVNAEKETVSLADLPVLKRGRPAGLNKENGLKAYKYAKRPGRPRKDGKPNESKVYDRQHKAKGKKTATKRVKKSPPVKVDATPTESAIPTVTE